MLDALTDYEDVQSQTGNHPEGENQEASPVVSDKLESSLVFSFVLCGNKKVVVLFLWTL